MRDAGEFASLRSTTWPVSTGQAVEVKSWKTTASPSAVS